jgi:FAD synthase
MNIGMRPTVNGKNRTIEVHILDFDQAIYGNFITVEILENIRGEKRFNSLEDLFSQIQEDEVFARKKIRKMIM